MYVDTSVDGFLVSSGCVYDVSACASHDPNNLCGAFAHVLSHSCGPSF